MGLEHCGEKKSRGGSVKPQAGGVEKGRGCGHGRGHGQQGQSL